MFIPVYQLLNRCVFLFEPSGMSDLDAISNYNLPQGITT